MPKKGKRSQSAKTRWLKFEDIQECLHDNSQNLTEKSADVQTGKKEKPSCEPKITYADAVKKKQKLDAPCEAGPSHAGEMKTTGVRREKPESSLTSYADAAKRGQLCDELCAAKPSHAQHVNEPSQPSVRQLCASRSQASGRYGKYKNMQCTCNSLTFLAFLCEDENITTADLDLVLDKGNSMYTDARKRFPADNHLATDQLPETVPARRCVYDADMSVLSRYGTFGDPPPGSVDEFLRFDAGLACLQTEIQYALLIMLDLCIAVFRTSSGRFGFFDPHSRSPDGLPTPPDMFDRESGTAVMLTFTTLYEMIDWLSLCYSMNGAQPSSVYELKPVKFLCNIPIMNESVPVPESRTPDVCVTPSLMNDDHQDATLTRHADPEIDENICSPEMNDDNTDVDMLVDYITSMLDDVPQTQSEPRTNAMNICLKKTSGSKVNDPSTLNGLNSVTQQNFSLPQIESEIPLHMITCQSQQTALSQTNICNTAEKQRVCKMSKIPKQLRKKMKRRQTQSQTKSSDRKENQKKKERELYSSNDEYKQKKKMYSSKRYFSNAEMKKKGLKTKYKENEEFKNRQKHYKIERYKKDSLFRMTRKKHMIDRYKRDSEFREKQKSYYKCLYQMQDDYREKKKMCLKTRYRDECDYREMKKHYFVVRYKTQPNFRHKKRCYIIHRYRLNSGFRARQKSYMIQRYANDQIFRMKHKQLMKESYRNNLGHCTMTNMIAMKIKRKYRQMPKQAEERDDPLITEAISVFRTNVKISPTYVCTSCHKACFKNQVKPCIRSNYSKNPQIISQCLTGKYVHVCDEGCINEQCKVPERRTEHICHTCYSYLKNGSMPPLAVANKLELFDVPEELSDLNILERHLVAKCLPFAKIIPLPKGRQNLIRGNVVCVPSEVQETVEILPRLRSESQVLRVKLKRRLCYKGHQLFQNVTWSKLMRALKTLKQIHPQYQSVNIRDEAELCDPTLPDDEDDDVRMEDEDYDEADLMEIDMCEKVALTEAEHEANSEHDGEMNQPSEGQEHHERDDHDNDEQEGDMPNGGFALESCLQPCDVSEDIMSFSDGIYSVAPAERNSPISFFKTPKLEAMAFPVQFPTGLNTLDEQRQKKLTPSSYFKSRLFCIDDRFARDTTYLFFAQFVTEIYLANSSMSIQLRKGKAVTRDGRRITSSMLQDRDEVERLVRNKDAVRFMQPLRGTPAYWEKTTRDLFAMIRQLGTPTLFCTFSAGEFRWPEVIEAIKRQQGEVVDFKELDWSTKCDILRSNPVTAMRMFDKRVEALLRDLIFSPAQPLGKVIDFFYRVEFQHRGSPHIHCLFWVEGAPVFEKDDDKTVCDFVDKYISAQIPDQHKQPELYKKVTEVQKHSWKHTRTCFKTVNSGCRFGFPKPPCRNTMISRPFEEETENSLTMDAAKDKLRPLNLLLNKPESASMSLDQLLSQCSLTYSEYEACLHMISKSNTVILKRDPKDSWTNGYNPHLLKAWDSNIDISYILNAYSCVMYLTKYITKKEAGLSDYLKTVIENSSTERINESDEMREVMQAYSKKREVSAQECVCRATGIHMKQSSRSVIFVPTDDNPVKMSRPLSYLESTTNDSLNIWMTSLTDKYKARPETPEFEEMCLADFASTCRIVYGKQTNGKGVLPLLNEMGFVQKRTSDKPAVIRYHRCSKEKNPEQYFGTMIKLYLPYRSDCELKSQHFPTYESFYECGTVRLPGSEYSDFVKNIVKDNRDKYEKNSEEIDEALEEYEENRDEVDEWCNLNPQSEMVRVPCDQGAESDHEHQENVPDLNRSEVVVPEVRLTRQPPAIKAAELQRMYQNLNQKQTCVFYKIRDWCLKRVCGLNPEQLFLYINGGAGTGKSLLIRCLYSMASKILSRMPRHADEPDISNPTVLLTSFTGTAAYNINGTTLHSLLKLPRSLKPPFQGLGNQLDEVRAELLNAEIIIIDEVSMVSKPLFAYVDARLKQIKGSQRPFGGMSVIAVGDFYQLPPVRQSKPLCVYDPSQLDLWQENFQMITLTEIMRQKDDTAFAEMLNRIRVKEKSDVLSDADRVLLAQTITDPVNCPLDALHIFATNKQVCSHNSVTLSRLHANTIEIPADDFKKDPRTGRMARLDKPFKGGKNELADTITVAEGARVMLTRNIDVHNGLVNGAFGKLVNVITSDSDQRVIKVGLKMDNDTAGGQSDNVVYVERVEENLKQKGVVRRQFPVKLAYACTIHKVQGMTTTKAVVSLKHVFEAGMSYVAISRVTSLNGLFLLDFDESKIYANTEVTAALDTMRQANLDDMMPLLLLKDTVSRPETMTIIHHNTEGLPAHICDIKNHHELHLADVLCLTETHLQGSFVAESLHLEGYSMFSRNRYLSYTNHPQLAKRRGGGVAIYVRNHITVTEKRYINNVTDLEFVVLKVEAPVTAFIVSVYRPPDYCLTSFLTNLESLLYSLELLEIHPIIVSGDFNVNVLVDKNTPVLQLFQARGYAQVITEATTEKNTLLDLMFVSRPQQCLQSGTMKSYYSYHEPVFCIMSFDRS